MVAEGLPTRFEEKYSNTVITDSVATNYHTTGNGDHMPGYNYMLFWPKSKLNKDRQTTVLHIVCIDDVGRVSKSPPHRQAYAASCTASALPCGKI
jgi:hypothetical protein